MAENDAFRVKKRINLKTNSSAGEDPGDIRYDSSGNLRLRDGSSEKTVLDNDNSVTVTNKSIDADNNTITNVGDDELTTGINANKIADGSVSNTEYQYIGGLTSDAQTQLDAKLESGTSATNIGNGDVDNTELSYLNGVTSSVQTQLDGKVDEVSSTDNAIPKFDGTGGSIQDTGVTIDDSNNLQAPADVDVDGTIVLEEQASTPSNPSSGDKKFYAKDDGSLYTLDSAGNEIEVGAGAGGGSIRYINADFETGVSDLVAYANTAQATPVDGTGGSPNVTVTAETSSPLVGGQSALFTKDANNRQGEGCAILSETIDEAYQDSVHTVEFLWSPDANVVEDELKLFVIHPTTGTVEALNFRNELGEYTNSLPTRQVTHRIVAEIAPIDDTYRVAIHVAGTSMTGYTGRIDNIQAGPQRLLNAPIVSDLIEYTPTSSWSGQASTNTAKYHRVGNKINIEALLILNATPSGAFTIDLPPGLSVDLSKINAAFGGGDDVFGSAYLFDVTASNRTMGMVYPVDSNTLGIIPISGSVVNSTVPFTWTSGDKIRMQVVNLPIAEWDSGGLIGSSQIDQQVVKVLGNMSANQSIPNNSTTVIDFDVTTVDTHNAFDTSTNTFTAPRAGMYQIQAGVQMSGVTAGTGIVRFTSTCGNGAIGVPPESYTGVSGSVWHVPLAGACYLPKGATVQFEIFQTNGGSRLLRENRSSFSIISYPDLSVFGVFPEKNLVQTKILSADVTSDITISDLTFNNLTVGKWYEVTGQIRTEGDQGASEDNVRVNANHNSTVIARHQTRAVDVSTDTFPDQFVIAVAFKFKAEATSLTFDVNSASANNFVAGNGTLEETYIQLEERNDLRETDKF